MFEGWASDILASYLGQVLDIQAEKLKVNLWKAWKTGITLEDVPLRGDVLHQSKLPLKLVKGQIGRLQVQVPWRALLSPLVISVSDFDVTLKILDEEDFSCEASHERYDMSKKILLASLQLQAMANHVDDGTQSKGGLLVSFVKHALSIVLGRIEVDVSNVSFSVVGSDNVRLCTFYVDKICTMKQQQEGMGGTIHDGISDPEDGKQQLVLPVDQEAQALEGVDAMHVESVLHSGSRKYFSFERIRVSWNDAREGAEEVLLETCFGVDLRFDIKSSPSRLLAQLNVPLLNLKVTSGQLHSIMKTQEEIEWKHVRSKYAHIRPNSFEPRAFWRYAIDSILLEIKGKIRWARWKSDKEALHTRRKYILLYRKLLERNPRVQESLGRSVPSGSDLVLSGNSFGENNSSVQKKVLSDTGEQKLKELEDSLSVSDILACRTAAEKSLLIKTSKASSGLGSRNDSMEGQTSVFMDDLRHKDEEPASCWVKIPTLSDIEELFHAVDFDPSKEPSTTNASIPLFVAIVSIEIPLVGFSLIPSIPSQRLDAKILGLHGTLEADAGRVSARIIVDGCSAHVNDGMRFEYFGSQVPFVYITYNPKLHKLRIKVAEIEFTSNFKTIISIVDSIPAPSLDSYQSLWLTSARDMSPKAYSKVRAELLKSLASYMDISVSLGRIRACLEDFEVSCEDLTLMTVHEGKQFAELSRVHAVLQAISSFNESQGSTQTWEAISELEDRLLFKPIVAKFGNLGLLHHGHQLLYDISFEVVTDVNRLFGDFTKPSIKIKIFLDKVNVVCLENACLAVQEVVHQLAPTTAPSTDPVPFNAQAMVRWADLYGTLINKEGQKIASVHLSHGIFESKFSDPSFSIFMKCDEVKLINGDIEDPSTDFTASNSFSGIHIPYICKELSTETVQLNYHEDPATMTKEISVQVQDLAIRDEFEGDRSLIERVKDEVHSQVSYHLEEQMKVTTTTILLSNIYVAHIIVLRIWGFINSHSTNTDQMSEREMNSPYQAQEEYINHIALEMQDVKVAFIHDQSVEPPRGLPATFQDFFKAHMKVTEAHLQHLSLKLPSHIADSQDGCTTIATMCGFSIYLGIIGFSWASMIPVLSLDEFEMVGSREEIAAKFGHLDMGMHPTQFLMLDGFFTTLNHQLDMYLNSEGAENEHLSRSKGKRSEKSWSLFQNRALLIRFGRISLSLLGVMHSNPCIFSQLIETRINVDSNCCSLSWEEFQMLQSWRDDEGDFVPSLSPRQFTTIFSSPYGSPPNDGQNSNTAEEDFKSTWTPHDSMRGVGLVSSRKSSSSAISRYYSVASNSDFLDGGEGNQGMPLSIALIDQESFQHQMLFSMCFNADEDGISITRKKTESYVSLHGCTILIPLQCWEEFSDCIEAYLTAFNQSGLQGIIRGINRRDGEQGETLNQNIILHFNAMRFRVAEISEDFRHKEPRAMRLLDFEAENEDASSRLHVDLALAGDIRFEGRRTGSRLQISLPKVNLSIGDCDSAESVFGEFEKSILAIQEIHCSFSHLHSRNTTESYNSVELIKSDISVKDVLAWISNEDLVNVSRLNDACRANFKSLKRSNLSPEDETRLPGIESKILYQLTLSSSVEKISLTLMAKTLSPSSRPLLAFSVNNIGVMAANFGLLAVTGTISFRTGICLFNLGRNTWEPFLDNTKAGIKFIIPQKRLGMRSEETSAFDMERGYQHMQLHLDVSPANFTVTKNAVQTLTVCASIFSHGIVQRNGMNDNNLRASITPCEICNALGVRVNIWLREGTKIPTKDDCPEKKLESGDKWFPDIMNAPICSENTVSDRRLSTKVDIDNGMHQQMCMYFSISDRDEQLLGPVVVRGSRNKKIYNSNEAMEDMPTLVVETNERFCGSWRTTLRGMIKIVNKSTFQLEFGSQIGRNGICKPLSCLDSGQSMWLPLIPRTESYVLRPLFPEHESAGIESRLYWSEPLNFGQVQDSHSIIRKIKILDRIGDSVVLNMKVSGSISNGELTVVFSPILLLNNVLPFPVSLGLRYKTERMEMQLDPLDICPVMSGKMSENLDTLVLYPFPPDGDIVQLKLVVLDDEIFFSMADRFSRECQISLKEAPSSHGSVWAIISIQKVDNEAITSTVISLESSVWVYNLTGIPLSISASLNPEMKKIVNGEADEDEFALIDLVPDSWILPVQIESNAPESPHTEISSISFITESANSFSLPARRNSLHWHPTTPESRVSKADNEGSRVQGVGGGLSIVLPMLSDSQETPSSMSRHVQGPPGVVMDDFLGPRPTSCAWPSALNKYGHETLTEGSGEFKLRLSRSKAPVGHTYWSTSVRLDSKSREQHVAVPAASLVTVSKATKEPWKHGVYPLVLKYIEAKDKLGFKFEKLSVAPEYILVNKAGHVLQYRQQDTIPDSQVPINGFSVLQWADSSLPYRICIRLFEAGWMWSGGFDVSSARDTFVKIRHRDRGITMIIHAYTEQMETDGSHRIVLSSSSEDFCPYRLENCSLETLSVRQKGVQDQQDILRPYCSLNYTWDEPSLSQMIIIERMGGKYFGTFGLNAIGFEKMISVRDKSKELLFKVVVRSEGPTRVLSFIDMEQHLSEIPRTIAVDGSAGGNMEIEASFHFQEACVSMISGNQEKLFASIQGFSTSISVSQAKVSAVISVDSIQVDNPSTSALYPVVLVSPAPESILTSRVGKKMEPRLAKAASCELAFWRKRHGGVLCFLNTGISMKSLAVYIEHNILMILDDLKLLLESARIPGDRIKNSSASKRVISEVSFSSLQAEILERDITLQERYYFDVLSIAPLEINLSFMPAIFQEESQSSAFLYRVISLADIEDARLWLAGFVVRNKMIDLDSIGSSLQHHYKRAFILELFKLVGAASVLGDPMSVLHHVGMGVWEFVSGPAIGLIESARNFGPKEFVFGLVSGTKGMMQNFVFAASNATTKASSAAHKAIVLWGFDRRTQELAFRQGRESRTVLDAQVQRHIARKSEDGLLGALLRGLVGLFTEPIKGAEMQGFYGFLNGIKHGALGAVLLPAAAFMEMSASTALSIRKAVAGSSNIGWRRPPRFVPPDVIQPYSWDESMGRWLLTQVSHIELYKGRPVKELFKTCITIPPAKQRSSTYFILTSRRILVIKTSGLMWSPQICWASYIEDIEVVVNEGAEVRIVATPSSQKHIMANTPKRERYFDRGKLFSVFQARLRDREQAFKFVQSTKDLMLPVSQVSRIYNPT